jgi:hypothetical protein
MSSDHGTTDADFFGMVGDETPGSYRFRVRNHLARLDSRLYGGTAIAVSLAAAEMVTERAPLWMTTQFVSTAPAEAEVQVRSSKLRFPLQQSFAWKVGAQSAL